MTTPKQQLDSFIAKFSPPVAKDARGVLAAMRELCLGAHELVYDNYNALAIGFATGERVRDVWFSIAIYPRWVSLFFFGTLPLADPNKRLKGTGKTTKHIVLADGAATLKEADVAALIAKALAKSNHPFPGGRGKVIIKSVSAKQRPRRPI
jgi:hypothetical protein